MPRLLAVVAIVAEAEAAVQALLTNGTPSEREALAAILEERARWAAISVQYRGGEWAELAAHLRSLAGQLRKS